jgi:hypothetical protein
VDPNAIAGVLDSMEPLPLVDQLFNGTLHSTEAKAEI